MTKQLPIGIQTFADIQQGNYYYVDKTPHILELLKEKYIFLSRPRRFGKSLTLDTIAELFSANKPLFIGLYAEKHWDWSQKHPVLRFTFAKGELTQRSHLIHSLHKQLINNAKAQDVTLSIDIDEVLNNSQSLGNAFDTLVDKVTEKNNSKVVILVDEYDKPILESLTDTETALEMRGILRDFYSVIKGQDTHIRFAMLTGVSRFSKVNLFSGINNLDDITIDEKFSALCGYTQEELEAVFAPELEGVDLEKLKTWYNGYNWLGESVYNPFDILLFFRKGKLYRDYWFSTGMPKFLVDKLFDEGVTSFSISAESARDNLLSDFDVEGIDPTALMFQTGYLTIENTSLDISGEVRYKLKYPNLEVQKSLNASLLSRYINNQSVALPSQTRLMEQLQQNDFDSIYETLYRFFESIPYNWHNKNNIAHFEGYWASVFYAYFASLGLNITVEDTTSKGRTDMTIDFNGCIYIFEFKVIEQVRAPKSLSNKNPKINSAMEQIHEKGYANKYRGQGKPIYLIGIEFSEKAREIADMALEEI